MMSDKLYKLGSANPTAEIQHTNRLGQRAYQHGKRIAKKIYGALGQGFDAQGKTKGINYTEPTALAQAEDLQQRLVEARFHFRQPFCLNMDDLKEPQVRLRFEAIDGMLVMAQNDVDTLVDVWGTMQKGK